MSISSGGSILQEATKVFMIKWRRAQEEWDDEKTREFEKEFIEPLKPRLRGTLAAMDRIADLASRAEHECG